MAGMNHSDDSHAMGHEHHHNIGHSDHQMHLNMSHFDMITTRPSIEATETDYAYQGADLQAFGQGGHSGHEGHGGHGGHVGHNGHDASAVSSHEHMDMSMTFHGGFDVTILFSWWKVSEAGEFIGSFFAIFLMALLYEGLKYYRKHLLWKTYNGLQYCAVAPPDKRVSNICAPDEPQVIQPVQHTLEPNVPRMLSSAHAWQTFLHGVQVLVSYMLMLVFMTYNSWLCAAVVLGSATGYFLFGWRESVVVDFTEHCH